MATSTERINQIMKEKKLRQIDVLNLAKPFQQKYNIKFSKSHLSQYVNGKSNPDNEKIFLLSKVFGVTEAWLLGYNVPRYERIENTIFECLNSGKKTLTISTAESCTGGMIASKLIEVPGISENFIEGIVSYSNEAKIKRLKVKKETLERKSFFLCSREKF